MRKRKIPLARIFTLMLALGAGWGSFRYHPELDKDSISILITIFTVLSGVLIAAITLVGNTTSLLTKEDWKVLQDYRNTFSAKLLRLTLISYLQIATIVVLFASLFYGDVYRIKDVAAGLSAASFVLSFPIPYIIVDIYREYYDYVIGAGRDKENKMPPAPLA